MALSGERWRERHRCRMHAACTGSRRSTLTYDIAKVRWLHQAPTGRPVPPPPHPSTPARYSFSEFEGHILRF